MSSTNIVDLFSEPALPRIWKKQGWSIESHLSREAFSWNPHALRIAEVPEGLVGKSAREAFQKKENPLNANLLDWLLTNEHCIPKEWEQYEIIFFLGTIILCEDDRAHVRGLYRDERLGCWSWLGPWIGHVKKGSAAVVFAGK